MCIRDSTNALDEAIALPTDFSARIARNTQIFIQQETDITREVDPWAGSYYVESLTNELAEKAVSYTHLIALFELASNHKQINKPRNPIGFEKQPLTPKGE